MGWFTRKRNTRTPNQLAMNARTAAYWQAKQKYGRSGQSRVANVFGSNSPRNKLGRHNQFFIDKEKYAELFLNEVQNKAKSISTEEKKAVIEFADDLKNKLENPSNITNNSRGVPSIYIEVPVFIAKLLLFLIGFALFAMSFAVIFVDIALSIMSGETSTMSLFLWQAAFTFMLVDSDRRR